jgi:ABC-2 type transport system permease protein
MTATLVLWRLALRRDRVRLAIWLVALAGVLAGSAASTVKLYPTHADLADLAKGLADTPATLAFYGPAAQLDTIGGVVMWKPGGVLLVLAGLMAILTVVRHTRAEEEAGLAELTGAGSVGRLSSLLAALLLATLASVALGVLVVATLAADHAGGEGALGAGLSFTAMGFAYAAIAAVAAQVCLTGRAANGLAGAVLAWSYALRAIADGAPRLHWLTWLSPIGWVQQLQPYAAHPRWWVLLLPFALAVALAAAAARLRATRDLGTAVLGSRPGRPVASGALHGPVGLVWRLQRTALASWVMACAALGALAGWLAASVGSLVGADSSTADLLAKLGGRQGLADSYLATTFAFLGVAASAYAVLTVLRLGSEEDDGRVEPVLAGAVSRARAFGAYLGTAVVGTLVLVLATGLTSGLARGYDAGDVAAQLGRELLAGLVQAPAAWLLAALAGALVGLRPAWVALTWVVLGAAVVLGQLGELLDLPGWVRDLSPYSHVPLLPAPTVPVADLVPLLVLSALAAGLALVGVAAYRRRDIRA